MGWCSLVLQQQKALFEPDTICHNLVYPQRRKSSLIDKILSLLQKAVDVVLVFKPIDNFMCAPGPFVDPDRDCNSGVFGISDHDLNSWYMKRKKYADS